MKKLILLFILLSNTMIYSQNVVREGRDIPNPNKRTILTVNDDCSNATTLTVNSPCVVGTTNGNTIEANENTEFPCNAIGGGGVRARSSWYRVNTGSNTELNVSIDRIGLPTNCGYHVAVYGPFTSGGGCLPTSAQSVYCEDFLDLYDPGFHFQVGSLTQNSDYLIQIMNEDCGGGNSRTVDYCIAVYSPTTNNNIYGSTAIDQCGVSINGTNIGYTPSNGLPGNENLDTNITTQCPTCTTVGEDVPYVVNNDSWFYFCATTAGTWNIDFTNISNCVQGTTSGLQMTIFRGTTNNLSVIEHSPNPSLPGSTWTSSNFNVSAGECVYLVVDGFAGDQCDYSYTLNNVIGGCNIILSQFRDFDAYTVNKRNILDWEINQTSENIKFNVLRSNNGLDFVKVSEINSEQNQTSYSYTDFNPINGLNYYRLIYTNDNSEIFISNILVLDNTHDENIIMYPSPVKNTLKIENLENYVDNINIFNNLGEKIKNYTNFTIVNNIVELDVSDLSSGVYLITIGDGNGVLFSNKIIKN